MDNKLRPYVAELIGTFALVFVGAGAVCSTHLIAVQPPPYLTVVIAGLAEGFALAAGLAATLNVSGGYLNPAVTLMLWVFKKLDGEKTAWLIGVQVLGALLAGLVLRLIFSEQVLHDAQFGTPHLTTSVGVQRYTSPGMSQLLTGIGIELVLTFVLTFVILGTTIDPRRPRWGWLAVGLTQAALILVAQQLTGAAANPARWLGPVLWELTISSKALLDHATYWIGPILGALLAGGAYTMLILPPEEEPVAEKTPARLGAPARASTSTRTKK